MKKKLIALILGVAMVLSLTACGGGPSASDYVKAELDEVKNAEADSLLAEAVNQIGADTNTEAIQAFVVKLQDFDYTIVGEEEDGDATNVTVEITTYTFGDAFKATYDQLMEDAMSGKLAGVSSDEIANRLYAPLGEVTDKSYTSTVVIKCTKQDDEWVGDFESDDAFIDAIFGGLLNTMQTLG